MAEKNTITVKGSDKEWGVVSPDCRMRTYSCASMFHAVMGSTISHMGYRESSRKEQSRLDHRTQDDNGNDGRRKKCLRPRGAPPPQVLTTSGPPEPAFVFPTFSPPRKIPPNACLLLCPPQPVQQNVPWG